MHAVQLEEAQQRLSELIEEAMSGKEVVILKDGAGGVKLVPVSAPAPKRKAGSARGMITMADDFDAPLEDFADYMP